MVLQGEFHPDFGKVAETLIGMLPRKGAGGMALCIYHQGEKVVDIWGGTRDRFGNPWERDTIVISASTTKGVTSTVLHTLIDQGLAHYDDPVAKHWPAFGCNGKETITIRQLMSHQAGLYNVADQGFDKDSFHDWQRALQVIEQATPIHKPGLTSGYHALNYGHLVGGLVEKISGRPFQQVMKENIADPLELDGLFIGVPDEEMHRLAKLISFDGELGRAITQLERLPQRLRQVLARLAQLFGFDFSHLAKALMPDFITDVNFNHPSAMQAIVPAANGAFTARSLARMYAALANGGELDGKRILSAQRIDEISQQQTRGRDRVVNFPMGWRLGYHQIYTTGKRIPQAFGHFGLGGSGAWCDPSRKLSMAMTLNTGVGTPFGDLRTVKISGDVIRCADRRMDWPKVAVTPVAL